MLIEKVCVHGPLWKVLEMFLQGLGTFALVHFHGASSFHVDEGLVLPGSVLGLRDRRDKGRRQANQDDAQPKPQKYLEE
jgi:hypothetical protein